jgi:hypothetical protein
LVSPEGCVICQPVKPHIAVEGQGADDAEVSLVDVANDAVKLIAKQLDHLKSAVRAQKGYDAELSDEVQRVAVSLSKVLTEVRKTRKEAGSAEAGMSFPERAAMLAEWYGGLPPLLQDKFDKMLRAQRRSGDLRVS